MDRRFYKKILGMFKKLQIVVVGDVMLDTYIHGESDRISPEAPVPIVREGSREYALGGAGNVASNIAALGGRVHLVGVAGNDAGGKIIGRLCNEFRVSPRLVIDSSRPTTEKIRIMASHHQVARLDREKAVPVGARVESQILEKLNKIKDANLVIFSDYAKGTVTEGVVDEAKKIFGEDKIIADFKPPKAKLYKGVQVIVPNVKEAHGITGIEASTEKLAERTIKALYAQLASSVVLKRGQAGMAVFERSKKGVMHIPTRAQEVFDVTGAGDTVIAALGLALAAGANLLQAAEIANHAAGIAVEREGTATVKNQELLDRLLCS